MIEYNEATHFNDETSVKAESLFKLLIDSELIVTLVISGNNIDYFLPVICKLKGNTLM